MPAPWHRSLLDGIMPSALLDVGMKNHHKAFKAAVIVLAAFFLFIAPVHDATIQMPPVEIYTLLDNCADTDSASVIDGNEICNEFICCTFEKLLLIRAEAKP